jgi:DNA modification methylase
MTPYYDHGGITIYHGDCREVLPMLSEIDVLFTSPPYGQQRDYERPIDNWITVVPCAIAATPKRDETQIIINLGLYHRDGEVVEYWDTLKSAMRAEGWRLFGWYVWDQGCGLPGDWNGRLAPSHEFVFHFNRKARQPNKTVDTSMGGQVRSKTIGNIRNVDGTTEVQNGANKPYNSTKIPDSVIRSRRWHNLKDDQFDHPAVMPERFAAECIKAKAT